MTGDAKDTEKRRKRDRLDGEESARRSCARALSRMSSAAYSWLARGDASSAPSIDSGFFEGCVRI
jgi:hypothetical protein